MGERTNIGWCHHTFNLWIGCWKIADECKHCYAEAMANRLWPGHWGRTEPRRFASPAYWDQLRVWNQRAANLKQRRRVFVGSMMDWAEVHPVPEINRQMDAYRGRLLHEMPQYPWLDFLLLTKRPLDAGLHLPDDHYAKPIPNLWLGVTAGTRKTWRENVHALRQYPAAVRFVSMEPLLEEIPRDQLDAELQVSAYRPFPIDWIIVGDESGRNRRPAQLDWVRTIREAALAHGARFYFKQWNQTNKKVHLPVLDGRQYAEFPHAA